MKAQQFGNKLKELIKTLNMTQREFSDRLGVNDSAISRYIKGEREPRVDLLWKISKKFNISLSYFDEKLTKKELAPDLKEVVCRHGKDLTNKERLELIKILSEQTDCESK